jgi:cytochrome b561
MSTPTGYSKLQIRLHWITVLLVALQYLLHDGIANAYDMRSTQAPTPCRSRSSAIRRAA